MSNTVFAPATDVKLMTGVGGPGAPPMSKLSFDMNDNNAKNQRKRAARKLARDTESYINATVPHTAGNEPPLHNANLNNSQSRKGRGQDLKKVAGKRKRAAKRAKQSGLAWISLLEKQGRAVPGLRAAHAWLKAVSYPFQEDIVRCPISYNPVPTTASLTAKTEYVDLNVTVAVGTSTQYTLFAGHGAAADPAPMDGVSYHSVLRSAVAATAPFFAPGPVNVSFFDGAAFVATAIAGTQVGALGLNTYNANFLGQLPWTTPLPFVAQEGAGFNGGGHTRWRLSSMGVEIINTTPIVARGGDVVTVAPTGDLADVLASGDNQSKLSIFPSFKVHDTQHPIELAWIPRPRDLAFWHYAGTPVTRPSFTSVTDGALYLFINNPTGSIQDYTVRIRANWEIAGSGTRVLQEMRVDHPGAGITIGPALNVAAEQPAKGPGMLEKIHQQVAQALPMVHNVGQLAEKAVGAVAAAGVGALGGQL